MGKNILVFSTVVVFLFSIAYAVPGIATFYQSYTRKNVILHPCLCLLTQIINQIT